MLQVTFQRRTSAGPAILTVHEIKLGAGVGTIHVAFSQERVRAWEKAARWSNGVVVYLADSFPAASDRAGPMEATRRPTTGVSAGTSAPLAGEHGAGALAREATTGAELTQFWYSTVAMSMGLKTRLLPGGVEWLHSPVPRRWGAGVARSRADLEVLTLDQEGELVARIAQVARHSQHPKRRQVYIRLSSSSGPPRRNRLPHRMGGAMGGLINAFIVDHYYTAKATHFTGILALLVLSTCYYLCYNLDRQLGWIGAQEHPMWFHWRYQMTCAVGYWNGVLLLTYGGRERLARMGL
ncbi:hypothetical protein BDV10DRAFT_185123 [Aspergillus recurvatus]